MSLIYNLVTDSRDIVNQTKQGIHPSETQHQLKKINNQLDKVKQTIHYLKELEMCHEDDKTFEYEESAIGVRLYRDRRSLQQMLNHLQSAAAHLQGHDWGIFAE